ncbi:MAG: hypothetical protein LBS83_02330, partial [Holosporales bacterium]|nr:hypothetical protein [Holosporales bacterium]
EKICCNVSMSLSFKKHKPSKSIAFLYFFVYSKISCVGPVPLSIFHKGGALNEAVSLYGGAP